MRGSRTKGAWEGYECRAEEGAESTRLAGDGPCLPEHVTPPPQLTERTA